MIYSDHSIASLFFDNGELIKIRVNGKDASKSQILSMKEWKNGQALLINWESSFSTSTSFLDDILCLASLLKSTLKLTCCENDSAEVHIKEGIVSKAKFEKKSGITAIRKIVGMEQTEMRIDLNVEVDEEFHQDYDSIRWLFHKNSSSESSEENTTSQIESTEEKSNIQITNNKHMNVKKLNAAVDNLKEQLGDSLVACDIWMTNDGQVIAGHNSQPKAAALFERMTDQLKTALSKAGFPGLGSYYSLVLENGSVAIILQFESYQWGMLLAPNTQMGLLMNIVIPQAISDFNEAVEG